MTETATNARYVPILPDGISACLFDLDGVLTQTAKLHVAAWKEMFDAFLLDRSRQTSEPYRPFEVLTDYYPYVDGKLRQDGARTFLASRGIALPEGAPDDPLTALTVYGLARRKNDLFLELLRRRGVEVYEGSVRFVVAVREAGLRRAVVTASRNCREVLAAAGLTHLFEIRIDGVVGWAKPSPAPQPGQKYAKPPSGSGRQMAGAPWWGGGAGDRFAPCRDCRRCA